MLTKPNLRYRMSGNFFGLQINYIHTFNTCFFPAFANSDVSLSYSLCWLESAISEILFRLCKSSPLKACSSWLLTMMMMRKWHYLEKVDDSKRRNEVGVGLTRLGLTVLKILGENWRHKDTEQNRQRYRLDTTQVNDPVNFRVTLNRFYMNQS